MGGFLREAGTQGLVVALEAGVLVSLRELPFWLTVTCWVSCQSPG